MIKGVIFDMDGVLLDNVEHHLEAFRIFGEEQGRTLTAGEVRAVIGQRNKEMLEALLQRVLTETEVEEFAARKEELYRGLIGPQLLAHTVPGIADFIRRLHRDRFGVALATSGPIENVDLVLDRLALRPYFGAVVTGGDVRRSKPHPDIFVLAAERLGLEPTACVVFEDSVAGVKAGLSAGCKCVAVATTHTRAELRPYGPHSIISDFTGLSPLDLFNL